MIIILILFLNLIYLILMVRKTYSALLLLFSFISITNSLTNGNSKQEVLNEADKDLGGTLLEIFNGDPQDDPDPQTGQTISNLTDELADRDSYISKLEDDLENLRRLNGNFNGNSTEETLLNEEIYRLKSLIDDLRKNITSNERIINDLRIRISELEGNGTDTNGFDLISGLRLQIESKEDENSRLLNETEQLKRDLADRDSQILNLTNRLDLYANSSDSKRDGLLKEISDLTARLDSSNKTIQSYKENQTELEDRNGKNEDQIVELKRNITQLESTIKEFQSNQSSSNAESETNTEEPDEKDKQIQDLQARIKALETSNKEKNETIEALTEEINQMKQKDSNNSKPQALKSISTANRRGRTSTSPRTQIVTSPVANTPAGEENKETDMTEYSLILFIAFITSYLLVRLAIHTISNLHEEQDREEFLYRNFLAYMAKGYQTISSQNFLLLAMALLLYVLYTYSYFSDSYSDDLWRQFFQFAFAFILSWIGLMLVVLGFSYLVGAKWRTLEQNAKDFSKFVLNFREHKDQIREFHKQALR